MSKKEKDSVLDDYEKLKNEIIRDKVNEIFRNHPRDYIAKMEEIGFKYFEDDDDYEEIEERNAKPKNQRQRDLVAYFENKTELSKKIFESYSEEKAAEKPNYPLISGINNPTLSRTLRAFDSVLVFILHGFYILYLILTRPLFPFKMPSLGDWL